MVGLSSSEARALLARHGPNEIRREGSISPLRLLAAQFLSPLVALLGMAFVVALALGERIEALAIAAILVLNALIGFLQEYRAERAVAALRSLTAPRARVRRDGAATVLPASEVVPGDVLLLEAGDLVAADAILLEANRLQVNEASLTGESVPVDKRVGADDAKAPLAERAGQVFLGTAVSAGTALARVTATGMATELGRIAHLISTAASGPTPIQKQLAQLGRTLLWLCLAVSAAVAGLGSLQGWSAHEVALSTLSLAVAAVPEGLPAIVTVALALGVQRLAAHGVLVRKLPAVETLGSVSVICTDKTGTLTTGTMQVRELRGPEQARLLHAAAACCDAELSEDGVGGTGDSTEVAILVAAALHGIRRPEIEARAPRVGGIPFDSDRKRMSIQRGDGRLYVKGALEKLLPLCSKGTEGAAEAASELAARALRVIAVAVGQGSEERDLELLGLIAMADPPRPEAMEAIRAARAGGIRVVMITGDHPATAHAIARELGIVERGEEARAGERVHARVTAGDKLRIVREWKERGEVVAMTGDGVNDAPALREASVGIAMGVTGTEVTREASDMILTDDSFAGIVEGIRQGRGVYRNIRKSVAYLLTGNTSELLTMLGAAAVGLPVPFFASHLLWINLVTDGLPALALVADPVTEDVMAQPPRASGERILRRREWRAIVLTAALEAAVVLALFQQVQLSRGVDRARALAFTTLVLSQLLRSLAARSRSRLYWQVGALTNLWLVAVVAVTAALQLSLHYVPVGQAIFGLMPLEAGDLSLCFGLALVPVSVLELAKLGRARKP